MADPTKPNPISSLSASEKRYRTLVETMGEELSEIDENQVTAYANRIRELNINDLTTFDLIESDA